MRRHGITMTTVRSLGGAAHSDVWLQMKADMLGVPWSGLPVPRLPRWGLQCWRPRA